MECFTKIVKGCNYFRNISFSRFLLYGINIMNFLKTGYIFTPEAFVYVKKYRDQEAMGRRFWYAFYDNSLSLKERPFGSLGICVKNFIEYLWIFVGCFNFFLETFQQLLETSEVEFFLSKLADLPGSFPQNYLEQVFCKSNLPASVL